MESGKFYIVVGATGEGKSTLVKKKFVDPIEDGERLYVYDVNNEYVEGGLPDFETFLDGLAHRRNSMIILEEATIFMGTQNDFQQVREVVIRKRHTGNIIVMVFHTLERIPAAIMPLVDGMYIFYTIDDPKKIQKKYSAMPDIIRAFATIQDANQYDYRFVDRRKRRRKKKVSK